MTTLLLSLGWYFWLRHGKLQPQSIDKAWIEDPCVLRLDYGRLAKLVVHSIEYFGLNRDASQFFQQSLSHVVKAQCDFVIIRGANHQPLESILSPHSAVLEELNKQFTTTNALEHNSLRKLDTIAEHVDTSWSDVPQKSHSLHLRQALLLVVDGVEKLYAYMSKYSVLLISNILYAQALSYDVLIYVQHQSMPTNVSTMFVKVPGAYGALFERGYETVLAIDWDAYANPMSAVPFSPFMHGWHQAGVFLQAEKALCAGVILYRRSNAAKFFFATVVATWTDSTLQQAFP